MKNKLQKSIKVIEQPRYGCALAAQQTVLAIPGAVPIVHAGPGCSSKAFGFAAFDAGFQGEGYAGGAHVSSTNMTEQDVVFGGEKKLRQNVAGALRVLKAELFVILTGCTADIVGDDSVSVARDFAMRGYPVVGAETAGFKGSSYYGHEAVMQAIIEQFVSEETHAPKKGRVNVFSVVPFQDPFWRGDLEEIKRLLEVLGLEPHVLFGQSSAGVREWRELPNAEFNLLISPGIGLATVKILEERYGTPYLQIPLLPTGAAETSRFLRMVGDFAGIPSTQIAAVIAREEKRFYDYFISLADFLAEYRGNLPSELYVVADSIYGPGIASFLVNELGFLPQRLYITDVLKVEAQQKIKNALLARDEHFAGRIRFENDGGRIEEELRQSIGTSKKAIILGSAWEKFVAEETSNLYVYISLPLNETVIVRKSYTGYLGGLNLIEDVYSSLFRRRTTTSRTQIFSA